MNLRALFKNWLSSLLVDAFRSYLETYQEAQHWTKQHCPRCQQPVAFKDALYCAFCGASLTRVAVEEAPTKTTDPVICSVQLPQTQPTDALYLPTGTLARLHHREAADDIGPHTQMTRAISKVKLQAKGKN